MFRLVSCLDTLVSAVSQVSNIFTMSQSRLVSTKIIINLSDHMSPQEHEPVTDEEIHVLHKYYDSLFRARRNLCTWITIYRPLRDGWLSWPCWLTDSERLNCKVVTHPASSLVQDRESSPAETSVLTTMLRRQRKTRRARIRPIFWSQIGLVLRPTVSNHITGTKQTYYAPVNHARSSPRNPCT